MNLDVIHMYNDDYTIIESQQKDEKLMERFQKFRAIFPNTSLPFSSELLEKKYVLGSLYSNPCETTHLLHKKMDKGNVFADFLREEDCLNAFKKGDIAYFQQNEKYYDNSFYKYPMFKWEQNDFIIVGLMYQSFCNYFPAIIYEVQVYSVEGALKDKKVIGIQFTDCYFNRMLNSFTVNKNKTITAENIIQKGTDTGTEIVVEEEIERIVYSVTKEGKIAVTRE